MARDNLKNGMVLGAVAGALASTPKISVWISDLMAEWIPASGQFLGSWSIPFYGIAAGVLIGFIIDKQ